MAETTPETPETGPAPSETRQAAADKGLKIKRLREQFLEQESAVNSLIARTPIDSREDLRSAVQNMLEKQREWIRAAATGDHGSKPSNGNNDLQDLRKEVEKLGSAVRILISDRNTAAPNSCSTPVATAPGKANKAAESWASVAARGTTPSAAIALTKPTAGDAKKKTKEQQAAALATSAASAAAATTKRQEKKRTNDFLRIKLRKASRNRDHTPESIIKAFDSIFGHNHGCVAANPTHNGCLILYFT